MESVGEKKCGQPLIQSLLGSWWQISDNILVSSYQEFQEAERNVGGWDEQIDLGLTDPSHQFLAILRRPGLVKMPNDRPSGCRDLYFFELMGVLACGPLLSHSFQRLQGWTSVTKTWKRFRLFFLCLQSLQIVPYNALCPLIKFSPWKPASAMFPLNIYERR